MLVFVFLRRRQKEAESHSSPLSRVPRKRPGAPAPASYSRRRWFRLAAILCPLAGLLLLELALRLAGYGYATKFLVHHPAAGPNVLVENQRFPWQFFPRTLARHPEPIIVTPQKPKGVFRVLVFGESAAEGDPAPAFGFSRILEILLRERYPGMQFELVNTAFTAINSHVIVPMARDCQVLQADVWLVYMGNNEIVGPFGTGTVFGQQSPPLPIVRASLALQKTRFGQWLDAMVQRLGPSREAAQGWGGMSMFLQNQVRQSDPRLPALHEHFRSNLQEIIALGRASGAKVLVSTVVSRLRDWAPFGSLHRIDLPEAQRAEWERFYQAGVTAEDAADFSEAIHNYQQASQWDHEFAELHFRWARCCLALGRMEAATEHFALARDLDTLRFRTDSALNDLIRETVAAQRDGGVRLLEAETWFAVHSTNGIPGGEWLCDHVHFTFSGNYRLARLFAEDMTADLPSRTPTLPGARDWLSEEDCADRLGRTDTQRYEVASVIERRYQEPVYLGQLDHTGHVSEIHRELANLRGATKPAAVEHSLQVCRKALEGSPNDWRLHELIARLLSNMNASAASEAEWRQVSTLIPQAGKPHTEIGKLEQQQGNLQAAIAAFLRAIRVNPDDVEAHVGLGTAYARLGRRSDARHSFRKALQLDPTRIDARDALAAP